MFPRRRYDEAICLGGGGIANNSGVVHRIHSIPAARDDVSSSIVIAFVRQSRGSGAENEGRRESNLGLGQHFLGRIHHGWISLLRDGAQARCLTADDGEIRATSWFDN
jgi:hypothetical protein